MQQTFLSALVGVLKPVVKLLLKTGIGFPEFAAVAKSVFVQVATEEYGIRGRPTNLSRVAAMTGISRKEVRRVRDVGFATRWTPDMAANPANSVIHYWCYDADFASPRGEPRPLPFDGDGSFRSLVKRYAGDIPPGAMLKELIRAGTVACGKDGLIRPMQRYFSPSDFHEDFVQSIAFALKHLGNTIAHNAEVAARRGRAPEGSMIEGRFQRHAWTERLAPAVAAQFQRWVRVEATRFVEHIDDWIGEHELPQGEWPSYEPRVYGVGVYYFAED